MKIFTEHPRSVNESYAEHMRSALSFSGAMLKGAAYCAVHAFLPFLFEQSGSSVIRGLYARMVQNR